MSSGPVGLDVREYVYGFFYFSVPATPVGFFTLDAFSDWLVTKVQYFAAAAGGQIAVGNQAVPVAANGCITFEPNGAYKGKIDVLGEGSVVIVEYWFQAQAGQFAQNLQVNVVFPP